MMNGLNNKNSNLSLDSLKGMQSVRATFTLPENMINLLSTVANQLGVKQKSIFDRLVENKHMLYDVADEAQKSTSGNHKRQQKTFVISRNSLVLLDAVAREYQLPRDVLVEFSIKRLLPVINAEKKRHKNRKMLLKEMENYGMLGQKIVDQARKLVGEDEPVYQKLTYVLSLYEKNVNELKETIERGKCMEEF